MVRMMLAGAAILIAGSVSFGLVRAAAWQRSTRTAEQSLAIEAVSPPPPVDLASLPPPVQRFFRRVLPPNPRLVRSAVATQRAEFFLNGGWHPLRATQHFRVTPPAFVWDASIEMAPMLSAWVRDSYIDGRGGLKASMMGAFTIADQVDVPELNAGALQRFLGEAVWLPTALLPSTAVSWAPVDDRTATATLTDRGVSVSLRFEFDGDGMVQAISGARYQEAKGTYTLQPWLIRCAEPVEQSGMTIPSRCEVSWVTQGRPEPYWRGQVTAISYQFN